MGSTEFRTVYPRKVIWGLIAVFTCLTVTTGDADARRARHGIHSRGKVVHQRTKGVRARAAAAHSSPPYSAIVVDANSGAVLHENSADSPRHPASLTKIMTLYLLFERLDAGKIKLSTDLDVSAQAAMQAPSKLGLQPGQTIRVEDAIRSLVTKSANDVAVVVAEALGDDEAQFARMMTRKARALGMSRTVYRNASGLPNPDQITTARDQALLGRAIQDRFPKYYTYFSTPSFTYRGHAMRNHNHLLGRVNGVDGIKTGYIGASGFNLVTSVRRGNRYLVAVVMGGRTAGLRDARMRELIDEHIVTASARRTAPMIVEAAENIVQIVAPRLRAEPQSAPARVVDADAPVEQSPNAAPAMRADPVSTAATAPAADPNDDLKPIPVKTVKVKASTLQTAAIGSAAAAPAPASQSIPAPQPAQIAAPVQPVMPPRPVLTVAATAPPPPAALPAPVVTPAPTRTASIAVRPEIPETVAAPEPVTAAAADPPARTLPPQRTARSGWLIQVGALETIEAANDRIAAARGKAMNILAHADAFTEPVVKGDKTLHRARFAGFDKDRAEAACRALKRADIVCMTIKN